METRKVIWPIITCVFVLVLSINLAQAATATVATVHTTDASGSDKIQFANNETVYIRWTADGTVNIRVEDENGVAVASWANEGNLGVKEFKPATAGYYAVYCTGATVRLVAYGTFFVVPEVPLGTIMAMVAGFSALGIFGTVKLKQTKERKFK